MGLIEIHLYFRHINYRAYDNGFSEPYHYRTIQEIDDLKAYAVYLNNPLWF